MSRATLTSSQAERAAWIEPARWLVVGMLLGALACGGGGLLGWLLYGWLRYRVGCSWASALAAFVHRAFQVG